MHPRFLMTVAIFVVTWEVVAVRAASKPESDLKRAYSILANCPPSSTSGGMKTDKSRKIFKALRQLGKLSANDLRWIIREADRQIQDDSLSIQSREILSENALLLSRYVLRYPETTGVVTNAATGAGHPAEPIKGYYLYDSVKLTQEYKPLYPFVCVKRRLVFPEERARFEISTGPPRLFMVLQEFDYVLKKYGKREAPGVCSLSHNSSK